MNKKKNFSKIALTLRICAYALLFLIIGFFVRDLYTSHNYYQTEKCIYSTSSTKPIELDYNNLPDEETTRLAIAEIYARYGQVFFDEDLNTYFNQFPWYRDAVDEAGGDYFSYYDLTPIEQYNVWLLEGLYEGTQDPSVF